MGQIHFKKNLSGTYYLKNKDNGNYITAWNDNSIIIQPKKIPELWEEFKIIPLNNNGQIALKTWNGNYISAWNNGTFKQVPHLEEWEKFTILQFNDGSVGLLTAHNTSTCVDYNKLYQEKMVNIYIDDICRFIAIPVSVQKPIEKKSSASECIFKFNNKTGNKFNNTDKYIYTIEFNISNNGKYKHKLFFNPPVTEEIAIEKVEEYLSKPLNMDYYEKIKYDSSDFWKYKCRGDLLDNEKNIKTLDKFEGNLFLNK